MGPAINTDRDIVLTAMTELNSSGIDCSSCKGTCCTFVSNTMQITSAEAGDIVAWLNSLDDRSSWVAKINESIERYRLNSELPGNGQRSFMRRRYTCPFYTGEIGRGCAVPFGNKPVGCLRFNPVDKGLEEQAGCRLLDVELAEKVSDERTLPIPVAVRNFLEERK